MMITVGGPPPCVTCGLVGGGFVGGGFVGGGFVGGGFVGGGLGGFVGFVFGVSSWKL
jgi:hypothetical protein